MVAGSQAFTRRGHYRSAMATPFPHAGGSGGHDAPRRDQGGALVAEGIIPSLSPSHALSLALVLACLLLMATAAGAQDVAFRARGDVIDCNRFTVRRLPEPAEGEDMGRLQVAHAGQTLFTGEVMRLGRPDVTLRLGLPGEGLATLVVVTFSGGAHCCFEACLLTTGPAGDECARVNLADGPPPVDNQDGTLTVLDWAFAYYENAPADVSFCFGASPAAKRLLVHDAKGWRVDAPGEYREYYRGLLETLGPTAVRVPVPVPRDSPALGRLMEAAYYRLMAGEPEQEVLARWRAALPARSAKALDAVFADVARAVRAFAPVTRVALPAETAPSP